MRRTALALLVAAAAGACTPPAAPPGEPDPGTEEIEISLLEARFVEDPPAEGPGTPEIDEGFTGVPRSAPLAAAGTAPVVVEAAPEPAGEPVEAPRDCWLARHQSADGSWDPDPAAHPCGCLAGEVRPTLGKVGTTGLALLAFLAQGETHKTPRYGKVVRAGLKFLKAAQREDGSFVAPEGPAWVREHALATLAMTEAYAMTQSPLFKAAAQNAVECARRLHEPGAGWSATGPPGPTDLETTVWATVALRSARTGGLEVDPGVFAEVLEWTGRVTNPATGIVPADGLSEGAASAGVAITRIFCGVDPDDDLLMRLLGPATRSYPRVQPGDGSLDVLHLYLGRLLWWTLPGARKIWPPEGERADGAPLWRDRGPCNEGSAAFFAAGGLGRIGETALAEECSALDRVWRCCRAGFPRDR
jgi:hypothetical protein